MKFIVSTALLCVITLAVGCNRAPREDAQAGATQVISEERIVEAGCGQCLFDMKGKAGCDLAVRVDGKGYFVDGFEMANFGDPHAPGGMCQSARQAKVTGTIDGGRFAATTFEMVPVQN